MKNDRNWRLACVGHDEFRVAFMSLIGLAMVGCGGEAQNPLPDASVVIVGACRCCGGAAANRRPAAAADRCRWRARGVRRAGDRARPLRLPVAARWRRHRRRARSHVRHRGRPAGGRRRALSRRDQRRSGPRAVGARAAGGRTGALARAVRTDAGRTLGRTLGASDGVLCTPLQPAAAASPPYSSKACSAYAVYMSAGPPPMYRHMPSISSNSARVQPSFTSASA
jgi:hypothetical protein